MQLLLPLSPHSAPALRKSKTGDFKRGMTPWNKKAGHQIVCKECRIVFRIADWQAARGMKFCSKPCAYKGRELKGTFANGHPDLVPASSRGHSAETRRKIAKIQRDKGLRGEAHWSWRGGLRAERSRAMCRWEYKEWRAAVFSRDDYTCQDCNARGVKLNADHIKPWSTHPGLRYDINNGRTLCVPCHMKQPTHGRGALKFSEEM